MWRFDDIVRDKTNDELGLLKMYFYILAYIKSRIIGYDAIQIYNS